MSKTSKEYDAAIADSLRERIVQLQMNLRAIELVIDGYNNDPSSHSLIASMARIKAHCRLALKRK